MTQQGIYAIPDCWHGNSSSGPLAAQTLAGATEPERSAARIEKAIDEKAHPKKMGGGSEP